MARGKYVKHTNTKALALMLALVLSIVGVVGGTVAWLIATPAPVINTFTYGDINIELDETDTNLDGDNNPNTNEYEMIPGEKITKDPKVTVKTDSENNWLFVKLEKSNNFDDFMTYTIADGWTQLYDGEGNEVKGVYYRYQGENTADVVIPVLKDNKVTVKETVTKKMLNKLDENGASNYPTLTVTAYAVQYAGFEAEVSEGATASTAAQVNAAALKAWKVI